MGTLTSEGPTLPTQASSSSKSRDVLTGSERHNGVHVLTCAMTAATYAQYFTGRVKHAEIAQVIEADTDKFTRDVPVALTGPATAQLKVPSLVTWLTQEKKVPIFNLIEKEKEYNWKAYMKNWLGAGGVVFGGAGHASCYVLDPNDKEIYQYDPLSGKKTKIDLETYKDEIADFLYLVPPSPENANEEMLNLLREQLQDHTKTGVKIRASQWGHGPTHLQDSKEIVKREYLEQMIRIIDPDKSINIRVFDEADTGLPYIQIKDGVDDVITIDPKADDKLIRIDGNDLTPTQQVITVVPDPIIRIDL